jgi:hypothetical protein
MQFEFPMTLTVEADSASKAARLAVLFETSLNEPGTHVSKGWRGAQYESLHFTGDVAEVGLWDALCPDGAVRYFDGDAADAEAFAIDMRERFGIDVRAPIPGNGGFDGEIGWEAEAGGEPMRAFWAPAGKVQVIYGHGWLIGS